MKEGRMLRSQSAMEYLMTYGWAILIIAVVLGALFQLGVFNAGTFAPRAPPGSCQVFRPNGPGSTSFINLEGVCSGELPQYVASLNGNSYITITSPVQPGSGGTQFSAFAWVYLPVLPQGDSHGNAVSQRCVSGECSWFLELYGNTGSTSASPTPYYYGSNLGWNTYISQVGFPINQWEFVGFTVNGGTMTIYADSEVYSGSVSYSYNSIALPTYVGARGDGVCGSCINAQISNVQIYNTSLSGPEVNALYIEGVSGAPINLQNLVAWWPLNGNANDYSGNNNNGVPSGITYTSSWTSSYTPP